jgi:hypothetical protein
VARKQLKKAAPKKHILGSLTPEELGGLRLRKGVLDGARNEEMAASQLRLLAEEGYIAFTKHLADAHEFPPLFDIDLQTGDVAEVELPPEPQTEAS